MLERLFAALDEAKLSWVLLRGEDRLERPSGDVDLLVAAEDLDQLDRAATDVGFRRVATALLVPRRSYLAYAPNDDLWIRLDVVTRVSFGPLLEYDTPTAEACLARRRRTGGIPLLDTDDALWHLLLHYQLDRGTVPERHRPAVVAAASRARAAGPLAAVVDRLAPGTGSTGLLGSARRGEWDELDRAFEGIRRSWSARRSRRQTGLVLAHRGLQRLGSAQLSGTRPGLSVAILGPDGAGKTTLARSLCDTLGLPTRYVYYGLWHVGRLERLASPIPGMRLVLLFAQLVGRGFRTRYHRARGRTVILDRFTYDAHLTGADEGVLARLTAAAVLKLADEPDLVLLLDLPGEVAFARKGEQSVAEIDRWRERYLALTGRLGHVVVLDATQPPERVRRAAVAAIWQATASRRDEVSGRR